jgi:hypothetical protein
MSGEEQEDSKPKLNLVISHSGTRTSSLVRYRRLYGLVLRTSVFSSMAVIV